MQVLKKKHKRIDEEFLALFEKRWIIFIEDGVDLKKDCKLFSGDRAVSDLNGATRNNILDDIISNDMKVLSQAQQGLVTSARTTTTNKEWGSQRLMAGKPPLSTADKNAMAFGFKTGAKSLKDSKPKRTQRAWNHQEK